jgi:opacity protein-like surface antigen
MKSLTVLVSSLLLAAAAAPVYAADGTSNDFYIGLSGRIDQLSWKTKSFTATYSVTDSGSTTKSTDTVSSSNFPETAMGMGLRFGYRISPYFAVETGYAISYDENKIADNDNNQYRYRFTMRQLQLDGLAYWPIGASGRFRPFLTAGLAYTSGDARLRADLDGTASDQTAITDSTLTSYFHKHEVNWRAGLGVEVGISQTVSARILARYQPYSFGALKGGAILGFDLNYAIF